MKAFYLSGWYLISRQCVYAHAYDTPVFEGGKSYGQTNKQTPGPLHACVTCYAHAGVDVLCAFPAWRPGWVSRSRWSRRFRSGSIESELSWKYVQLNSIEYVFNNEYKYTVQVYLSR